MKAGGNWDEGELAVIRLFLLLLVFVTMISMVLHVSAGWAWIIALLIIGGVVAAKWQSGSTDGGFVTPSAAWKCPYCLKRTKLGATVCHHCTRSLLRSEAQ
jgi:hypothetical protein